MKKIIKRGLIGTIIGFSVMALTSCEVLATLALIFLTGGLDLGSNSSKSDDDAIELVDDGTSTKFSSSTSFTKLQKFHGDLSSISNKSKNLWSIQVNRASVEKFNTGYIYPYDYQQNRSAENIQYPGLTPVIDEQIRINKTPSFINDFKNHPELYLNDSVSHSSARVTIEDIGYGGGSSSGSGTSDLVPPKTYNLGSERSFYVADSMDSTNKGSSKTAVLKYKGKNCLIYLAKESYENIIKENNSFSYSGSWTFSNEYLTQIGEVFDKLYSNITNVMGSDNLTQPVSLYNTDKYGKKQTYSSIRTSETGDDSKLVIFINDLFDDQLGDKSGSVLGYFWAGDLYPKELLKYSNECKMIYMDAYNMQLDVLNNTKICHSTLVHEFTHMLNRINKTGDFKTWWTEMMAMTAEDIMSANLEVGPGNKSSVFFQRLPYFNITYAEGFSDEIWGKQDKYTSAYSNTYAFGSYLLRNYGGVKLINKIATNSEIDEASITAALKSLGKSETFDSVLAKWGQVLCNFDNKTTQNTSTTSYITLNRKFSESFNSTIYNIQNVDISQYYIKAKDDYGKEVEYKGPVYGQINQKYSIGGYGIEVKHFGELYNYQKFDCQLPLNKSCDLYIYIK